MLPLQRVSRPSRNPCPHRPPHAVYLQAHRSKLGLLQPRHIALCLQKVHQLKMKNLKDFREFFYKIYFEIPTMQQQLDDIMMENCYTWAVCESPMHLQRLLLSLRPSRLLCRRVIRARALRARPRQALHAPLEVSLLAHVDSLFMAGEKDVHVISTRCIITGEFMEYPCKFRNCTHPECFDMSGCRLVKSCPICGKPALNVVVDPALALVFKAALQKLPRFDFGEIARGSL